MVPLPHRSMKHMDAPGTRLIAAQIQSQRIAAAASHRNI